MDSGKGIPKDIQVKLMEPFFTTKGPTQGTGLGLNLSRRIAFAHGGQLELNPKCLNTCFILKLPIK